MHRGAAVTQPVSCAVMKSPGEFTLNGSDTPRILLSLPAFDFLFLLIHEAASSPDNSSACSACSLFSSLFPPC